MAKMTERPGYFVAFADNVGTDTLTFKILKNDLSTILHISVVRSATDTYDQNKRVSFKPDVQETLKIYNLWLNSIEPHYQAIDLKLGSFESKVYQVH
jgi:hypothetical protein